MCSDDRAPVVCVGTLTLACAATCTRPSSKDMQAWMSALTSAAECEDAFVFTHLQWIRHCARLPLRSFVSPPPPTSRVALSSRRDAINGQWVVVTPDGTTSKFIGLCVGRHVEALTAGTQCVVVQTPPNRADTTDLQARIETDMRSCAVALAVITDECCCGGDDASLAFWDALGTIHAAGVHMHFLRLVQSQEVDHAGQIGEPFRAALEQLHPSDRFHVAAFSDVEVVLLPIVHTVAAGRAPTLLAPARSTRADTPLAVRILAVVPAVATGADQIQAVHDLHAIASAARRHGSFVSADYSRGLHAAVSTANLLHELNMCEVWHFTGHGDACSPLHFARREPDGRFTRVLVSEADLTPALASMRRAGRGPVLILLMGCNTGHFAYRLAAACPGTAVIAWATALSDAAANAFCEVFYDCVAHGMASILQGAASGRCLVPGNVTVSEWVHHTVQLLRERGVAFIDPEYGYRCEVTESGMLYQVLPVSSVGRIGVAGGVLTCILPTADTPLLTAERLHALHWGIAANDDVASRAAGAVETKLAFGAAARADPLDGSSVFVDVGQSGLAAVADGIRCFLCVDVSFLAAGMTAATDRRRHELARLAAFVVTGEQSGRACDIVTQLVACGQQQLTVPAVADDMGGASWRASEP